VVTVQRAFRTKYAKDPPTWPRWPKGSNEEYRCTHVDACVARTWIYTKCRFFQSNTSNFIQEHIGL